MRKKLLVSFLAGISCLIGYSQEGVTFDESFIRGNTSKFLKSPGVASMEQYGNYPVSEATGIPNISIPIYTIKAGDLEYPISLSYHIGGIRVDDIPSCVGLGWTLNAGGAVSRIIKGIADEDPEGGFLKSQKSYFYNNSNQRFDCVLPINDREFYLAKDDQNIGDYMERGIIGNFDTQSDSYNYQVYPINGSFVYNTDRKLVHQPYSDNRISREYDDFVITSDAGVRYLFSGTNVEYTYSNDTPNKTDINGFRHDKMNSGISSWLISKITSANRKESIEFEYKDDRTYDDMVDNWIVYYGSFPSSTSWNTKKGKLYAGNTIFRREKLLSCIKFSGGKVDFTYSATTRKDKRTYALEAITVRDNNNTQLKKVVFSYGNFISVGVPSPLKKEDYRLKLLSIKTYGQTESDPQLHLFSYNDEVMLPPYFATPADNDRRKSNKGQDYWGYYNGVNTNTTLVGRVDPSIKNLFLGGEIADREPSEKHMKACILTKIAYPTGGFTVFETEANRIYRNSKPTIVGGLRIKSIKSFLPGKTIPEKMIEYEYEYGEDILWPDIYNYTYKKVNSPTYTFATQGSAVYDCNYYTENPITPIGYYSGSAVIYKKVIKRETNEAITGPNEKKYNGKTVYFFDSPTTWTGYSTSSYQTPIRFTNEFVWWNTGKIRKQEKYYVDEAGHYQKVEQVNYDYDYKAQQVEIGQYSAYKYNFFGLTVGPGDIVRKKFFHYYWFNTCTGYSNLVEERKTSYSSPQDSLVLITQYTYGNLQSQPTKINSLLTEKRIYSDNHVYRTNYFYPQNFETSIHRLMMDNNMLSPIIEEETYFNNKRASKIKTDYYIFGNGIILPQSIQLIDNNNVAHNKIFYDKYDWSGNPIQYTKDGISTVFLWGYNNQYPIAEIKNVKYEQILNIIPETILRNISDKYEPTPADWALINDLRTNQNLKNAHVSTHSFKPLVGLQSTTNPSGFTTYYNYDIFARLKSIHFLENGLHKIQDFDYHYGNIY